MFTMHPTLLIGPADWDPVRMPKEEFLARIEALWRQDASAGGAIVYGDSRDHADLAYLTNFTPKLEPAIALFSRAGEPRLLVGGGANMLPAAKPLTWVETLVPLRNAGKTIAEWARALPSGNRLLLIGGDRMRYPLHNEIVDALGAALLPATARAPSHTPRNSPREIAAIRESCTTLAAAVSTFEGYEALESYKYFGAASAVLAAEDVAYRGSTQIRQVANRAGAQDVRTLFSLDGGRTLQAFSTPMRQAVDPFQVYLAVRQLGYWVEGFVMIADKPHRPLRTARSALRSAIALARAGARRSDLFRSITAAVAPERLHPVTDTVASSVVSMGLSLEEISPGDDVLATGEVISIRAGVLNEEGGAIVSAMLLVEEHGHELLWSSLEAGAPS
jgi:hypothetical protein